MSFLLSPLRAALSWPVDSQLRARRNAMIASTSLAQRRAELDDLERFLTASTSTESPSEVAAAAAPH